MFNLNDELKNFIDEKKVLKSRDNKQKNGKLNYTTDINIINKEINQKFKTLLLDDGLKRIYLSIKGRFI